ncbi:MAG: 3-deoxy-D-manno-octulosonic acid kinase [Gammaproteobacteria bacterium]|nr:3-deoxy-D-manno-octulosonic acid kinase [Gammaproteobacteria bacterium]
MTETVEKTATGAILYDKSIINQISEDRFTANGWLHSEILTGSLGSGGRGNTMFVGNVPRQFVLRHFHRGGLMGKINRDRYFWTGEESTRSFAEWRLLAKMAEFDLRVPRPAAARYRRSGTFYTADIITVRIPDVRPLSAVITEAAQDKEFWGRLGAAIHHFHAVGVYHADMNAYNLQIDADGELWMLDFDRGELRQPGRWQQQTLSRLHRSLEKIRKLDPKIHFRQPQWEALLEGYFDASRSA